MSKLQKSDRHKINYLFNLECVNGGRGWGATGQKAQMTVSGSNYAEAVKNLKKELPGGWSFRYVEKTDETFYLKHTHRANGMLILPHVTKEY